MPRGAPRGPVYRPLAWPFLLGLFLLLFLLAPFLLAGVSFAFGRVGIGARTAYTLLVASLFGSFINIPLWRLPRREVAQTPVVSAFGVAWRVPLARQPGRTLLAVNVGGGVIPVGVSTWILAHDAHWPAALAATAVVAALTNRLARPVKNLGIAVPALAPPLAAAAAALVFAGTAAAPAAFVAGTLGTLIGADLLNLHKLSDIGAAVASIGGAGTFDGIFLAGVLGVILATAL